MQVALALNREWHSRVPELRNQTGKNVAFCAIFGGRYFAVAIWGEPIARMLNGKGMLELRRMAIAPDAPKNTGSRMLRVMRLLLRKERLGVQRLISYQDTDVHAGTIQGCRVDCVQHIKAERQGLEHKATRGNADLGRKSTVGN